jgi:hypothetical protein
VILLYPHSFHSHPSHSVAHPTHPVHLFRGGSHANHCPEDSPCVKVDGATVAITLALIIAGAVILCWLADRAGR